jgi:hypothetical protein
MTSLYQTAHTGRPIPLLRYLDVVVVLVAAIPALALGAPVLGYALGGGAWILSRVLLANRHRWVPRIDRGDEMRRVTVHVFEAFGRIWLLAGAIVVAGVAGRRQDGLTAALVIFCAYSVAFVIRLTSGPPESRIDR